VKVTKPEFVFQLTLSAGEIKSKMARTKSRVLNLRMVKLDPRGRVSLSEFFIIWLARVCSISLGVADQLTPFPFFQFLRGDPDVIANNKTYLQRAMAYLRRTRTPRTPVRNFLDSLSSVLAIDDHQWWQLWVSTAGVRVGLCCGYDLAECCGHVEPFHAVAFQGIMDVRPNVT
jgi:hypothetical protein